MIIKLPHSNEVLILPLEKKKQKKKTFQEPHARKKHELPPQDRGTGKSAAHLMPQ